ncbi:MAG: hypothetical protein IJA91_05320 [Clostridia bacterium]|nr:hypothetical protein [Clostridia bacterium]
MRPYFAYFTAFLLVFLCFSACSPTASSNDFSYAAAPFTAAVRGTYTPEDGTPRPIAVQITVGEPISVDDLTNRPMKVTITQPATLAGITVAAVYEPDADGKLIRTVTFTYPSSYGEVSSSSQTGDFDGFLRFAEALLPFGDITDVSPTADDGTHTVTRTTANGTRKATFLFSQEQVLPLRVSVRGKGIVLDLSVTP